MDEFNTLVELCEQIGPETWENFSKTPLEDNAGYANVSEVVEEMESALALLLDGLSERLMEKGMPHPQEGDKPKSKAPGSGRF